MHQTTIFIEGNRHAIPKGLTEARQIYDLGAVDPSSQILYLDLSDDRDVPLSADEYIIISGAERFAVGPIGTSQDSNPRLRKPIFPVMNESAVTGDGLSHCKLNFEQVSSLDSHFLPGDGVFVELRDIPDAQIVQGMTVVVQTHDRFYTTPCGNVGDGTRLEIDVQALETILGPTEMVKEEARCLVLAKNVPLPKGWSRASTQILMIVPQGYPMAAMDMFWVPPGLALANGSVPQNAEVIERYLDRDWQRFSWHYTNPGLWNPCSDGILSHTRFVLSRLARAF